MSENLHVTCETVIALDAIGDGKIWLVASANSLAGLPPELISRFQIGGIWFFDLPTEAEKLGILKLKLARYGLDVNQDIPAMVSWTGRDINNLCAKAQLLDIPIMEAAEYVVPLLESHRDEVEGIRQAAHNRFLSATNSGKYQYAPSPIKHEVSIKTTDGRKFRT